ncbi:adenylosuccinate synthase [Candidatus Woesearchaeota archaeon]|nr:adenylosuccinate synthase [Candidatus Woesearchaeota archaeon]
MQTVVIGLQWGDEGKGKIIDYLVKAAGYHTVVRYQGGPNAGHTVRYNGSDLVLRQLPTGVLTCGVKSVMGNGMVIDLGVLVEEKNELGVRGFTLDASRLVISDRAHVILPSHLEMDVWEEKSRTVGTTKKGIGPAYMTKAQRTGVRMCDFASSDLRSKIDLLVERNKFFAGIDLDPAEIFDKQSHWYEIVKSYIADTGHLLRQEIKSGSSVLFESAQGTMLDNDHGTYPYTTSSSPTVGGVMIGTGVPLRHHKVVGIAKAYTTRVGEGPFPTEMKGADGALLRDLGQEFGSVTRRPRRCGWFDAFQVRYAVDVNGADEIILTKLDILSNQQKIWVGTGYMLNGVALESMPASASVLDQVSVSYKKFDGWTTPISRVRKFKDFPDNAKKYVDALERMLDVHISHVSVGKETEEIVTR